MKQCFYCSSTLEICQDHYIPSSYYQIKKSFDTNLLVDCCQECNVLLSDELFNSLDDRAKYLIKRYKSRYKKLLRMPEWTVSELIELNYNLKNVIQSSIEQKSMIEHRIEYLKLTARGL